MLKIIKAECYKLFHSIYFPTIALTYLLLFTSNLFDSYRRTQNIFEASIRNIAFPYFLILSMGVCFFGTDFDQKTIAFYISAGHKRSEIFLAKAIVFMLASLFITAGSIFVHIFGSIPFLGHTLTAGYVVENLVIIVPALLSMSAIAVLIGFAFKNVGGTLGAGIAVQLIVVAALNSKTNALFFMKYLPVGHSALIVLHKLDEPAMNYITISIIWILVCLMGGYLFFRRADMK